MLSCAAVAAVYAMTGSNEPDRWIKEGVGGFVLMFGGIMILAVVVFSVAKWVG